MSTHEDKNYSECNTVETLVNTIGKTSVNTIKTSVNAIQSKNLTKHNWKKFQ